RSRRSHPRRTVAVCAEDGAGRAHRLRPDRSAGPRRREPPLAGVAAGRDHRPLELRHLPLASGGAVDRVPRFRNPAVLREFRLGAAAHRRLDPACRRRELRPRRGTRPAVRAPVRRAVTPGHAGVVGFGAGADRALGARRADLLGSRCGCRPPARLGPGFRHRNGTGRRPGGETEPGRGLAPRPARGEARAGTGLGWADRAAYPPRLARAADPRRGGSAAIPTATTAISAGSCTHSEPPRYPSGERHGPVDRAAADTAVKIPAIPASAAVVRTGANRTASSAATVSAAPTAPAMTIAAASTPVAPSARFDHGLGAGPGSAPPRRGIAVRNKGIRRSRPPKMPRRYQRSTGKEMVI